MQGATQGRPAEPIVQRLTAMLIGSMETDVGLSATLRRLARFYGIVARERTGASFTLATAYDFGIIDNAIAAMLVNAGTEASLAALHSAMIEIGDWYECNMPDDVAYTLPLHSEDKRNHRNKPA